jgi:hypothetical protein
MRASPRTFLSVNKSNVGLDTLKEKGSPLEFKAVGELMTAFLSADSEVGGVRCIDDIRGAKAVTEMDANIGRTITHAKRCILRIGPGSEIALDCETICGVDS